MKEKFFPLITIFFLLSLFLPNGLLAEENLSQIKPQVVSTYAPNEIIVKFKPSTEEETISSLNKTVKAKMVEKMKRLKLERVKAPKNTTLSTLIKKYERNPAVEYAEPNYLYSLTATPNDTFYSSQWAHPKISSPSAWDINTGSSNIIAVVDTGVDYTHSDLAGKVINGPDYFNDDSDSFDDHGHGTHVAGIAAAISNNNQGVAGVSWGSQILGIKVLGAAGFGTVFDIAQGINYAANNGAKVINLSLGSSSYSQTMKDATDYASSRGVVIVAATGNEDSYGVIYPAANPNVIGVGATNENDARCSPSDWGPGGGSNYGPGTDVAAPGNDIFSTYPGNRYVYMSGTSMATPYVAGLAALVLSKNPSWSPAQVESQIEGTADDLGSPGRDDEYGYGRINAARALQGAAERIWGQTSEGTAVAISQTGWGSSRVVLVARNDHFADALAGVPLAYAFRNAPGINAPVPLLLTTPRGLSSETRAEIQRLGASTVIILGGPGAILPTVETELWQTPGVAEVQRIWGETAPGTARDIFLRMRSYATPTPSTAIIATQVNFQDALAVSSPAAANNMPILLSNLYSLPLETLEALSQGGITRTIIVGGGAVVSGEVETDLNNRGYSVLSRLWGNTEYDTAVDIATSGNSLFNFTRPGAVFVARGDFFTDALSGGALASRMNPAPIVLTEPTSVPAITQSYLSSNRASITRAYILGGPGAITSTVENQIKGLL